MARSTLDNWHAPNKDHVCFSLNTLFLPISRVWKDFLLKFPNFPSPATREHSTLQAGESECESHSITSDSLWPHILYSPWNSPSQHTGVGSHSFLQGIFPTQGSNPGLLHCKWILYQLSHKGHCPRTLEWVAYPFSSRSSWPRNWTRVSCIAGRFYTDWAIRLGNCFRNKVRFSGRGEGCCPASLEIWAPSLAPKISWTLESQRATALLSVSWIKLKG